MAVDTMECLQALERWAKSMRSVVEESPFSKEMEEKCPGMTARIQSIQSEVEPILNVLLDQIESMKGGVQP